MALEFQKPDDIPSGFFWCIKCKLTESLSELVQQGNCQICREDVNSYGSLQHRWKTNRSLKSWWMALGETEQANWYRKHQGQEKGAKRKFDNVNYGEINARTGQNWEFSMDGLITWIEFLRRNLPLGSLESPETFGGYRPPYNISLPGRVGFFMSCLRISVF